MARYLNVSLILDADDAVCANLNRDSEKRPFATVAFGRALGPQVVVHFNLDQRQKLRDLGTEALRLSFELDKEAAQIEADARAAREREEVATPRVVAAQAL